MGLKGAFFVLLLLGVSWVRADSSSCVNSDVSDLTDFAPCPLCKTIGGMLITSLGRPATQAVVNGLLNSACVSFTDLAPECTLVVNSAAPILFSFLRRQKVDALCTIFVCQQSSPNSYNADSAAEVMHKVDFAAIQFQVIESLLKVCDTKNHYAENCKQLASELMPLILTNAKQFLGTSDPNFY